MQKQVVGVVGLGLLGKGIASCLAAHGFPIVAFDPAPQANAAAQTHIGHALGELANHDKLPREDLNNWKTSTRFAESLQEMRECDFVIESITENFQAKQKLFDELEDILSPQTTIASNTSALSITFQQRHRRFPERFIGMHWAEPCHLTSFLEVIRGELTSDQAAEQTVSLGKALGKDPTLVLKDIDGFIVNRLGYAIYREALFLLEQGVADAETIDRAFSNAISVWAPIMGPFRWMDLTGLPAYAAVMERLFPQLSNATEVPAPMKQLMESGAQGVRNGHGFYSYSPGDEERWQQHIHENVWRQQASGSAGYESQSKSPTQL